jgi:Heterokaryon incompatibility protein (HET)
MTSVCRTDGDQYDTVHDPEYNVLSYTWGRFTAGGPSIDISGVSWVIPSIETRHFSVDNFGNVLHAIAPSSGYTWVDVACIDQHETKVKMDEIGKQGDIFRRATKVFVWLSHHDTATLSSMLAQIDDFARVLESYDVRETDFEYDHQQVVGFIHSKLGSIYPVAEQLLRDPWFSSLWTLQEAYLRDDAVLLSQSGEVISRPNGRPPRTLRNLISDFQTIKLILSPYETTSSSLKAFLTAVESSGLINIDVSMTTPMLLYSAAHFRTCTEELDRVYGIMQVYGLRLGASKQPERSFSLDELEDQLAAELNKISPVAAQLFIHMKPPPIRKAWRVAKDCTMPEIYYLAGDIGSRCTLSFHESMQPQYVGRICSLTALRDFWLNANAYRETRFSLKTQYPQFVWSHYQANIDLDANQRSNPEYNKSFRMTKQPQKSCPCSSCRLRDPRGQDGLDKYASSLPLPLWQYSVLLLGMTTLYHFMGGSHGYSVAAWAGLLAIRDDAASPEIWRRVGICSWEAAEGTLKPVHDALWNEHDCLLA